MDILSALLFVFSCSIDTFIVAIAYGIKNIKVSTAANLIIAFMSALGTLVSMNLGLYISNFIPIKYISILGNLSLLCVGLYFFIDGMIKKRRAKKQDYILYSPEKADQDLSGYIDFKESITLSLALSINNFALGIAGSLAGLNLLITTTITFIFSIIFIPLGIVIGKRFMKKSINDSSSIISGLIIIIISFLQIII